jgi:hypothetical protein
MKSSESKGAERRERRMGRRFRAAKTDMRQSKMLTMSYDTQHEAITAVECGIASGRFKNCAHLALTQVIYSGYVPVCKRDSFIQLNTISRESVVCPKDCRLFEDRVSAAIAEGAQIIKDRRLYKRRMFWQTIGKITGAPFKYFKELPAIVQSLLIILLIIWLLPKAKDTIIEILKALH